jgi:hypothetical protein
MKHDMTGFEMDARLRRIADHLMALKDSRAFNPASVDPKLLPHMFVLDIERDSVERGLRLRIRLTGTAMDLSFRRPLRGHFLEDYIHGPRGGDVITGFHHCARTGEPLWMRQIVRIPQRMPRFVEGVVIYLESDRLYGGLVVGEYASPSAPENFERAPVSRSSQVLIKRAASV